MAPQFREREAEAEAMDAPDRYKRFVVPECTKKVSYEKETKIINAASFTIEREDHTIGNVLRICTVTRMSSLLVISFLALSSAVKIHTASQSSPMQAYNQAIYDLDKELDHLKNVFEAEIANH